MLAQAWFAALTALFLWWFSTGAILFVVRNADSDGPDGHVWASLLSMPVLFAGVVGLMMSLPNTEPSGAYVGFLAGLAIWGWIEQAFLSGLITGPNKDPCPTDASPWLRFRRAWASIAYHDLLLLAAFLLIWGFSIDAANKVALWTFGVLFFARVSAQLNLYLGVPHINTEFIPRPLSHLPSYFSTRKMNWLFPISISALTFATACWLERLYATGHVGFALLATITALAALEHWLMVLPLPDAKLWRWMLPAPKDKQVRMTDGL
ncbi:MAG: putative photosynthetic complex assembly protein PuhE [Boseongicola sp.]|nr:putative photosynthetic complex assembly protein PuhE [Boseongicola sp.]MDD9979110.1 putative photosynthetic complex assembly protein PuhE [Boseongicola sp.]